MNSNYIQVFEQMADWNEDQEKFFAFIKELQKKKEEQEEIEKNKKKEQLT